jgi:hypothetical protein
LKPKIIPFREYDGDAATIDSKSQI